MCHIVAVSHGACHHRLHFAISRKIDIFARSFRRLFCVTATRILCWPTSKRDSNEEPEFDTCSPRRKAIWDEPCRIPCDKKGQCFVCVLFLCVLFIIHAILYIYIYIYIYVFIITSTTKMELLFSSSQNIKIYYWLINWYIITFII